MTLGFKIGSDNKNLVLNCIKIDFSSNINSNIANGVVHALVKYCEKKTILPFMLDRHWGDDSQYLPVDNISYIFLKSMVKHLDFESNKRQIMLNVVQILFKNSYFFKKYMLPKVIYVYNINECQKTMKEYFRNNAGKYLKRLPEPANIEGKYSLDKQTRAKLDMVVSYLFKNSLNMAIFNLFDDNFNILHDGQSAFELLYKALLKKQKTAQYKPSAKFMNNLKMLANEHVKVLKYFKKLKELGGYPSPGIYIYLKKMEMFLLLSENFGYQIPQNLKDAFKNKINMLISAMKTVFASYNHIELEHKLSCVGPNTSKDINEIAENICSTLINENAEYCGHFSKISSSQDFITSYNITGIGYNYIINSDTYINPCETKNLLKRLSPFIQNKNKYASFSGNAIQDHDFPLFEYDKEGYDDNYYLEYGYYRIRLEDTTCYINLAKIINQMVDSPYPYEFNMQRLVAELPEIMPFISSAFCDIPKIC